MEWLAIAEFQYNDKRYAAIGRTPFKLKFRRHLWKDNLVVQSEISRVEEFLAELQNSWEQATCYKTSVWTDSGRVRIRTNIGQ